VSRYAKRRSSAIREQSCEISTSENNIEMADSGKDLNDYTVIELKSFLQILGAKTSGAKAELIQRLSSLNKEAGRNAWYVPELINQSTKEDNVEGEATRGSQQETTVPENMQEKSIY